MSARWSSDAQTLLVTCAELGRHTLHRYSLADESLHELPVPGGTVFAASSRPDGSVHALVSSTATPPQLIRVGDGPVVDLGAAPPSSVVAEDVFAEGPGGRVHALMMRPTDVEPPARCIFLVHGGPTGQDFDSFHVVAAGLVDNGYTVVRVNYRGSTGYGAKWRDALHTRVGFTELEDIDAIRSVLEAAGTIAPDEVAIAGGSWGGFLTLFALGTQPDRWKCGAALVPLADWFVAHEDQPPFMTL